jgi:hypothetical protein
MIFGPETPQLNFIVLTQGHCEPTMRLDSARNYIAMAASALFGVITP